MSSRTAEGQPRLRGWARIRQLGSDVLGEHASPARLGVAVAVGALIGSSPLVGLHAILALAVASAARLNRLATFAGSNVSIGPMMPILCAAELAVGSALLGEAAPTGWPQSPADAFSVAARALWVGWLVVGVGVAGLLGAVTFVAVASRDRRAATTLSAPKDPPASG